MTKEKGKKPKNYDSKNIKFFYSNSEDCKILKFLDENNVKFGTIVKELLIEHIDGKNVYPKIDKNVENRIKLIVQEVINQNTITESPPLNEKLNTIANDELDSNISIKKSDEINMSEKIEKENQRPNILNQIKNMKK